MKKYKIDIMIGYTNGKYVRETVYTPEEKNEKRAIAFAGDFMKLQHNMLNADMFFVYSVQVL